MRAGRPEPTAFRRRFRPAQTEAERRLWNRLRDRRRAGIEFVRQETTGSYGADLCCREVRSIIQVDGGQHAESTHDRARNEWLTARGYRILRFWNAEVMNNMLGLLATILAALPPLPACGKRGKRGEPEGRR
ncbi:endonuclease domain-containing protein [Methylobacterium gregans]|uniref:endonuclease domain-containing protein n=1 Tax=Methylobacterium gregans TaxID=374424 RepID=UPI0036180C95